MLSTEALLKMIYNTSTSADTPYNIVLEILKGYRYIVYI